MLGQNLFRAKMSSPFSACSAVSLLAFQSKKKRGRITFSVADAAKDGRNECGHKKL
jgi:hypothetical protein